MVLFQVILRVVKENSRFCFRNTSLSKDRNETKAKEVSHNQMSAIDGQAFKLLIQILVE